MIYAIANRSTGSYLNDALGYSKLRVDRTCFFYTLKEEARRELKYELDVRPKSSLEIVVVEVRAIRVV